MASETVTERLLKAMNERGRTKADLARASGVTPQAVGRWFKTNSISKKSLYDCANYLGVSVVWLTYGDGTPKVPDDHAKSGGNADIAGAVEPWDRNTPLDQDEVEVPFYMEVELSAGHGSSIQIQTNGPKLRFAKSTLKRQGVDPSNAACVTVRGNSMEPVLPDGATVGIDSGSTSIKDGEMYAIDWHGELYVKTLTRKPGGGLRIRSFNFDEYPDENLGPDDVQHVRVIGRVFWYSVLR